MPAAPVTVRGHQGMVVMMRFLRREGMFCRTCALASFRDMQADTMVMGWWGPLSVFITPLTLLANLSALSGIRRIPEPATAGFRPPLDPGKPVFRRPAGILALIPLSLVGLVVAAIPVLLIIGLVVGPSHGSDNSNSNADHPTLTVGSCARNATDWPAQDLRPEPCDSPSAELRVLAPTNDECAAGDYLAYLEYSKDGDTSLCLHPLKR
ncbi:LppU/SCO3897 family protein [Streptomyces sp. NPDC001107]